MFEPISAGIAVAIFNKYILNKFDFLALCYAACCEKEEEDCTSSASTSTINDASHVHHF
jgi:hypothetical protein